MPSFVLLFGALTNVSNKGRLPKNGRTNEKTERASSFRRRLSASKGRKSFFFAFCLPRRKDRTGCADGSKSCAAKRVSNETAALSEKIQKIGRNPER